MSNQLLLYTIIFIARITSTSSNPCDSSPCSAYADCRVVGTDYDCNCTSGYMGTGHYCYVDQEVLIPGICASAPFPNWFQCLNSTCIDLARFRDGHYDCPDGEDEACATEYGYIRCDVNTCVKPEDVLSKCPKEKHTLYCYHFNMSGFRCWDGKKCIPSEWVMNGNCTCDDCSDELTTTSPTTSSTTSTTTTETTTTPTTTTATTPSAVNTDTTTTLTTPPAPTTPPPVTVPPPFPGTYEDCWNAKAAAARASLGSQSPVCSCGGQRLPDSDGVCHYSENVVQLQLVTRTICQHDVQFVNDLKTSTTTRFLDFAYMVAYGIEDLRSQNPNLMNGIAQFCVSKEPMAKGSVLTNLLVQTQNGMTADASSQALSDAMTALAGQVGASGLGAAYTADADECADDSQNECSENADCSNTFGGRTPSSYTCTCKEDHEDRSPSDGRAGLVCEEECDPGWWINDACIHIAWIILFFILLFLLLLLLLLLCLFCCCRRRKGTADEPKHNNKSSVTKCQQTGDKNEGGCCYNDNKYLVAPSSTQESEDPYSPPPKKVQNSTNVTEKDLVDEESHPKDHMTHQPAAAVVAAAALNSKPSRRKSQQKINHRDESVDRGNTGASPINSPRQTNGHRKHNPLESEETSSASLPSDNKNAADGAEQAGHSPRPRQKRVIPPKTAKKVDQNLPLDWKPWRKKPGGFDDDKWLYREDY